MNNIEFNQDLIRFLSASKTPFHAVREMASRLLAADYIELSERDSWVLQAGQSYFLTRNDSSILAFVYGQADLDTNGIRMIGAHTDSPCLKVKPHPELKSAGYFQLGVEVYGGALLNPWFDRDLSLAGKVSYRCTQGKIKQTLIDFSKAIAVIPSLAIHLDRDANQKRSINKQTDILPVLMRAEEKQQDFRALLQSELVKQGVEDIDEVLDYDLSFYDVQAPALVGLKDEFLTSARLDNLLSCYVGLQALLDGDTKESRLLICNDHEEVGSRSACGAQGPMLDNFLNRLIPNSDQRIRVIQSSLMVSADNAHGVHPNFADKHDGNHGPKLNDGPVIKINSNQSYATNSHTSAIFRNWCQALNVPVQAFVTRSDMGCGSTIGPITAGQLGVEAIDVGVPTFAMHSIREMAGSKDAYYLFRVLSHYVKQSQIKS